MNFTLIYQIIGVFIGIGAIAAGAGYGYAQFKRGFSESAEATVKLLNEQVTGLTVLVNTSKNEIKELERKVDALEKGIEERDKKISEYMTILQNRDPQMEQHFKETSELLRLVPQITTVLKNLSSEICILKEEKIMV